MENYRRHSCVKDLSRSRGCRGKFAAGITLDVVETIAEDDKVVARVEGKVEGTCGAYNNTYCHVFTVRDGKIVENIEYVDSTLIRKSWYGRTVSE